jgi:CheY-like chemotaxis protein
VSKKILVIDDEELIIKSLAKLLEKSGFEVFVAKNGLDALAMVEDEHFDLLIADIRMPGMNGVEIIDSVNQILQEKKEKPIPVIFITGYADAEIEKRAKILKPLAYIYKPFDIGELVGKVREALK